jgi:hypothetical protein
VEPSYFEVHFFHHEGHEVHKGLKSQSCDFLLCVLRVLRGLHKDRSSTWWKEVYPSKSLRDLSSECSSSSICLVGVFFLPVLADKC